MDFQDGHRYLTEAGEFRGYDYKFIAGSGGHDGEHGGASLPDFSHWLWRTIP